MEQLKATSVQRFIKTNQSKEVIEDKLGVYQPKACINQKYSTTNGMLVFIDYKFLSY